MNIHRPRVSIGLPVSNGESYLEEVLQSLLSQTYRDFEIIISDMRAHDQISHVIDLNPHKHGRFVPVTGQEIVAPEFLKEFRPDVVITMNPVYRDEIADKLRGMNLSADCIPA
jgi:cellulose synthase/poly-beta-1,6-N-acetylglucosamine synthase-like glycosyltransferase